jgi:hypothetical protein
LISFGEHTYFDDPLDGHPDVRTRLKNAEYFFFGNGLIQGAVQLSPSGEGSPFGLLVMDPEKLTMKRNTLTMDKSDGLAATSLFVYEDSNEGRFDIRGTIRWSKESDIPVIEVLWSWQNINITEKFYCPDRKNPAFIREIILSSLLSDRREIQISTSVPGKILNQKVLLSAGGSKKLYFSYSLHRDGFIGIEAVNKPDSKDAEVFWKNKARIRSDCKKVEKFFNFSGVQLASMISSSGKMDASIWQYNREWVRDHSFMCLGLIYTGYISTVKIFLERLIRDFVSDEGDTKDSSEKRNYDEVELDQNGLLLYTIGEYLKWTGDSDLILRHKEKITSIADFPLRSVFRDIKSGLLHNSREYWERHSVHGITDGFEFAYQIWVIKGLQAAASMGESLKSGNAKKWEREALNLMDSLLNMKKAGLVNEGSFIKRRNLNGQISKSINPSGENGLPEGTPLKEKGVHLLNPDSSLSQTIVYGITDPLSKLAVRSMENIEELWNQAWKGGGYGRYNVSSEPDSPGPWPFPSIFIARAYHKMRQFGKVERVLTWLNEIPGGNSGSWFENYGERISPPYPQVGIPPWTWAEIIMLVMKDILGIEPEGDYVRIRPNLLPSINRIEATIPIRGMIIDLNISRTGNTKKTGEVLVPIVKERVSVRIEI